MAGPRGLSGIAVPGWRERFGAVAGVTDRSAGDLGLSPSTLDPSRDRWMALSRDLGFSAMATSRQVHGSGIAIHRKVPGGWSLLEGYDAHATAQRGLLLTLTVADCIPVFLLDPVTRAIALAHAGWRGTAAGILPATIQKLVEHFGAVQADIVIHFGVGICGTCYEVGLEVIEACGRPAPSDGQGRLDLRAVLADQARAAGVRTLTTSPFCSAHDARFFSHRASGGRDGRMAAYLGWPDPANRPRRGLPDVVPGH